MSTFLADHVQGITMWFAAFCTLGLYSVLYKENKLYRLVEHLFLGLATGYLVSLTWTDVLLPKWWEPLWKEGKWWYIFIAVFGSFFYFIFSKKHAWMSRIIIGFFLGVASGQAFQAYANDFWPQIPSSFKPIFPHPASEIMVDGKPQFPEVTMPDAINNVVFMVIIVCVMSYFFFSFEHKHAAMRGSAKLGRWMMMFTFGAIFGSTIMARLALLIDRMDFLLNDFGQNALGSPLAMFCVLLVLMAIVLYLALKKPASDEDLGST